MTLASKFFDITPKISPRLAVFPGDQAFSRKVALDFAKGDHLALSSVTTTVHLGAHADAPSHYHASGVSIDQRHVGRYMGLCQVLRVSGLKPGERISLSHVLRAAGLEGGNVSEALRQIVMAPRVLFYTGSFPDPDKWVDDFNSFDPAFLEALADVGVKLVGIDTPSVDPSSSKGLEAHQVLFARDIAVLEGLWLKGVPEGIYTLIAPPLPIVGGDASPVRALLLPEILEFPELEK